ncbi:MAG TPA: hypothetical protein PLR98_13990 [Chitinophagaceae bacterium]|nr:hypothetical protein [Chitinophagaceae bacterium]HRK82947.1 hypothetical protein [Saprospiraceae bacterium]
MEKLLIKRNKSLPIAQGLLPLVQGLLFQSVQISTAGTKSSLSVQSHKKTIAGPLAQGLLFQFNNIKKTAAGSLVQGLLFHFNDIKETTAGYVDARSVPEPIIRTFHNMLS